MEEDGRLSARLPALKLSHAAARTIYSGLIRLPKGLLRNHRRAMQLRTAAGQSGGLLGWRQAAGDEMTCVASSNWAPTQSLCLMQGGWAAGVRPAEEHAASPQVAHRARKAAANALSTRRPTAAAMTTSVEDAVPASIAALAAVTEATYSSSEDLVIEAAGSRQRRRRACHNRADAKGWLPAACQCCPPWACRCLALSI